MRIKPKATLPQKRLIVPSGVSGDHVRNSAMANVKIDSMMASFLTLNSGKWWIREEPLFDSWEHYRYLDSGAFTFLKLGQGTRIKAASKARVSKSGTVSRSTSARTMAHAVQEETTALGPRLKEHFRNYIAYLRANLDKWDFVCDMDVDTLDFGDTPGVEVTWACRRALRKVAGDKLLPVWHPIAGWDSLKDLCATYPYIAIGSDMNPGTPEIQRVCDYAHTQGVLVHGFGTSRVDILNVTPFDTVDSTTWISSVRYGQFMGWRLSAKDSKHNDARSNSRALRFRSMVEEMGYDPDVLLEPGSRQIEKYEVALRLMMKRQDEAPPVREPRMMEGILD
jgi:hypothetical protein